MKKRAVLSVEAAAILPVFLMGLLALASLLLMYDFRMKMQAATLYCAQRLSVEAQEGKNVALSTVREQILDYFGEGEDYRYVYNGSDGIDVSESFTDNHEYAELTVSYDLVSVIDTFGLLRFPVKDKCVLHYWCGYENGYVQDDGEYVYITENSEVYHADRECSHIKLDIIKTSGKDVGRLRNDSGAKYYRCENCRAKKKDAVLYVTSDGDRYHNSLACPGLKRSVRSIPKSEALGKGLRPCGRCAK